MLFGEQCWTQLVALVAESVTTWLHLIHLCSLLNSALARCSWMYLSLVSLALSLPFPPTTSIPWFSCVSAVIACLGEHNHRHCLSCNPFPTGIRFNSIQFNSICFRHKNFKSTLWNLSALQSLVLFFVVKSCPCIVFHGYWLRFVVWLTWGVFW